MSYDRNSGRTRFKADTLNDYLDEQARLRHLEQSWTPTGQET